MTDSEMVERVAREVLGWSNVIHWGSLDRLTVINPDVDAIMETPPFSPFHDANDLMMVLEKFDWWKVGRNEFGYYAGIEVGEVYYREQADTLARAICEAALKAVEK